MATMGVNGLKKRAACVYKYRVGLGWSVVESHIVPRCYKDPASVEEFEAR